MPESYTDDEIVDIYRRGKSDRNIMKILCELSCKPREDVLTILHAAGEALPETPGREKKAHRLRISDEVWRAAINAKLKGTDPEQICVAYHINHNYLKNNWRKKAKELGIPLPDHQITSGIQCIPDKIRKEVDEMEEKKTEFLDEEPREATPCDIMSDTSYFLRRYPGTNFKLEYSDGAVELHAVIPVKEAAV